MRILLVNNHHKLIGGAERYYFDLAKLLKKGGHEVAFFSTNDSDNKKTKWSKYFIKKLDFKKKSLINSLEKFPKIFYNFEAKRNISRLLDDFKPDIVHIQNCYYYISSSILNEIKKRQIPIIQTVHDYQLISPNVVMYHDGEICEITKPNKFYKAIFHKCVKHSFMASLMSVITLYFQNLNGIRYKIDLFIAPSKFMKSKMLEYGYPKNKIIVLQNFLNDKFLLHRPAIKKGDYVLYYGRICEAKGIFLLLEAASNLPEITFVIAGNFEDREVKKSFWKIIKKYKLINITYKKFMTGNNLFKLIQNCKFAVVPSLWYENQPYSITEPSAFGKSVIASNIAGIPELVINGKTGKLYKYGDVSDLTKSIKKMWNNNSLTNKLGVYAHEIVNNKFLPELHKNEIMKIYKSLIHG